MKIVTITKILRSFVFNPCLLIIPFIKRENMDNLQRFGGNWTEKKLDVVNSYFKPYTTALNGKFTLIYVDAFAGTGYRKTKNTVDNEQLLFQEDETEMYRQFRDGSAKLALETSPPFSKFFFIEIDPVKCTELEKLKEKYPNKAYRIEIMNEDANLAINKICDFFNQNASHRGVIFVDPFAMSASWRSLQKIAATKCLDMWYLFPISAVNRLLKKDGGKLPESWKIKLNDTFGDTGWETVFYSNFEEKDLFGNTESKIKKTANFKKIGDYLIQRLESVFAGVAKNPITLYNNRNSPLFLLCFACGNENGRERALKIAQDILKKR